MLPRVVEVGEPFHPLGTSMMADWGLLVCGDPEAWFEVEADGSIWTLGRDDDGVGRDSPIVSVGLGRVYLLLMLIDEYSIG